MFEMIANNTIVYTKPKTTWILQVSIPIFFFLGDQFYLISNNIVY